MNRILIGIHFPLLANQLNCGIMAYFYAVFVVLCWFGVTQGPGPLD